MTDQAILETEEELEQEQEVDINLDDDIIDAEMPEPELGEEEEPELTVGDEEEEPEAFVSNPVRQLRTVNRDLAKKLKLEQQQREALERKLQESTVTTVEELPKEPDIGDDGIDYDPEKFKQEWAKWNAKKSQIEAQKAEQNRSAEQAQQKFQQRLQAYEKEKPSYKGIETAEQAVTSALNVNQQGIIINYADNPALLVSALGKNPVVLAQLAAIKDPIEYSRKIWEIEKKVSDKMSSVKKPAPEPTIKGGGTATKTNSNHEKVLDKLRSEGKIDEARAYRKKHNLF